MKAARVALLRPPFAAWQLLFVIGFIFRPAYAESSLRIREVSRWSLPEQEIRSPRFSKDGGFLALVTRFNWPDGVEAEGYEETFGPGWDAALRKRAKSEPRFEDPIVHALDLTGKEVCTAKYGWNPDVMGSPPVLVYSSQEEPITGKRELAEALTENTIRLYDCARQNSALLAKPTTGYLDEPRFTDDGRAVVFTYNQAVNGSFGGAVGLAQVDLNHRKVQDIVSPRRTGAFYGLVSSQVMGERGVLYLVATPRREPGDLYLASHYKVALFDSNSPNMSYSLGEYGPDATPALQSPTRDAVLLYDGRWRPFKIAERSLLAPLNPSIKEDAIFSPDQALYARVMHDEESDPVHVLIFQVSTGRQVANVKPKGFIREFVWSPDGRRFAIVATPPQVFKGHDIEKFHVPHDEIVVYALE